MGPICGICYKELGDNWCVYNGGLLVHRDDECRARAEARGEREFTWAVKTPKVSGYARTRAKLSTEFKSTPFPGKGKERRRVGGGSNMWRCAGCNTDCIGEPARWPIGGKKFCDACA